MRNTVESALQNHDFRYQLVQGNDVQIVFRLGIVLNNGRCDSFIDIRESENQVLIYTVCPMLIPEAKRNNISEFLTRVNHDLILGNFELDYKDGELRYKCAFLYDRDSTESEFMFMRNLYSTFNMMDRYLPGIMSVVYANVLPAQAVAQIENSIDPLTN